MSRRIGQSSFERVFPRQQAGVGRDEGEAPAISELFAMAMRDQLSLPEFAEALSTFHGVRLTQAAARLMSSVAAANGTLPFHQFQKALHEDDPYEVPAGRANAFTDQARAIIEDNLGQPQAPQAQQPGRLHTDISADPFIQAKHILSKVQANGPFSGGIVRTTNKPSAGNPLASRGSEDRKESLEDPYGVTEMVRTATRMFVSGELDRRGYEKFLERFNLRPSPETELFKLIVSHDQVGDASFNTLLRAVQRELDKVNKAGG